MGYADGYYYGQGRIICDTSTFSVGDTIRVRSMTDSNKVWNKTVATVGTALVFTVPPYDYYTICQVVNNTEIKARYTTLDYGQTYLAKLTDKKSLQGVQDILNAHQENDIFSIGDEVTITVNGADWTMQVGGIDIYDTHEIILVSKYLYDSYSWNTGSSGKPKYSQTPLVTQCDSFYLAINGAERELIKYKTVNACYSDNGLDTTSQKVWLPTVTEIFGGSGNIGTHTRTPEIGLNSQFPIFTTATDRIRQYNNTATQWFTASQQSNNASTRYWYLVTATGTYNDTSYDNMTAGILPCFHLVADS